MEKRMERSLIYNGTITAEQFLFYEIRIASKYYLDGTSVEDAIEEIKKNNLFQYPTERLVARMVRSCYKRLDALDDEGLSIISKTGYENLENTELPPKEPI